ncbi:hypothetical protein YC2023_002729 [Brassica napus]
MICVGGSEEIHVSDSLMEVLREETRLPWSVSGDTKPSSRSDVASVDVVCTNSINLLGSGGRDHPLKKVKIANTDLSSSSSSDGAGARPFHWQFYKVKDCLITEDLDSVAHLVRHFKSVGSPLPSLWNMMECDTYVKMAFAHAKAYNEFGATVEQMLKDVPCDDELKKLKKVVRELKLSLNLAHDRECANYAPMDDAEKLGNQATSLEAR